MKKLGLVAVGAMALAWASGASAAIVVDQNTLIAPPTGDGYYSGSSISNRYVGSGTSRFFNYQSQTQSLTVGQTGTLQSLGLQIYGTSTASKVNVSITRGYLFNPDASGVDDFADPLVTLTDISLRPYGDGQQNPLFFLDLSSFGINVAAGEVLSLGVTATAGSNAAWVFGTMRDILDQNGDFVDSETLSEAHNDGGYNVIETDRFYADGDSRNVRQTQVSGLDRAFITLVDVATSSSNALASSQTTADGGEVFNFAAKAGERVYIDPVYATGFDYVLGAGGPNIADVLFPALSSDADGYEIYDLAGNLLGTVGSGIFTFTDGGVRGFKVRGIDGLEQGAAFVTGLSFTGAGNVSITQTPVLSSGVPEPGTWMMMIAGFGAAGTAMRRRRTPRAAIA